jgi:hypothetical protein
MRPSASDVRNQVREHVFTSSKLTALDILAAYRVLLAGRHVREPRAERDKDHEHTPAAAVDTDDPDG